MKRTNFSNVRIKKRRHGYLIRTTIFYKKKILKTRRAKGRKYLSR